MYRLMLEQSHSHSQVLTALKRDTQTNTTPPQSGHFTCSLHF